MFFPLLFKRFVSQHDYISHPLMALSIAYVMFSGTSTMAKEKTYGHSDHDETVLVQVYNAWSPPAPPVVPTRAGYLQLTNTSEKTQLLQEVSSEAFQHISIHRTVEHDGFMSMEMIDELEIPPGATRLFAPGGLHLMMMQPTRSLTEGDQFLVTFNFAAGPGLTFEMTVSPHNSSPQMTISRSMSSEKQHVH